MNTRECVCVPSTCRINYCAKRTDIDFQCATPACTHPVHGSVVYGESEFLDAGYAIRPQKGVMIDNTKNTHVGLHNPCEYYCESCSEQHPRNTVSVRQKYALASFMCNHDDKHITVPETVSHMPKTALNGGRTVEIRVLGPGFDKSTARYPSRPYCSDIPNMRNFKFKTSSLPVKSYDPAELAPTGLEKFKDLAPYNVMLGAYVDGEILGHCELVLDEHQVKSKGTRRVDTVMLLDVYVDLAARGCGIRRFMLEYVIMFMRQLKTEFECDNDVNMIAAIVNPDDLVNNRALENLGFVLQWSQDDAPFTNKWIFSLRTSAEDAQETVKRIRFLQHLTVPAFVHIKRDIEFAFMYTFQDRWYTGVHSVQIPTCSHYMANEYMEGIYKIYNHLETDNAHPPMDDWLQAQIAFFTNLSEDEHLTLMTHSYQGDQMVNAYKMHGTVDPPHTVWARLRDRTAESYSNCMDGRQYLNFQAQMCSVYGEEVRVRNSYDLRRIAGIMCTWEAEKWSPVIDAYIADLHTIFAKAPPLQHPMTAYRGEQCSHKDGDLADPTTKTNRVLSFTFDPTIAAYFSRNHSSPMDVLSPVGTIYKITWQPGSKLVFSMGSNPIDDLIEMELIALDPELHRHSASNPELVPVEYARAPQSIKRQASENAAPTHTDTYAIVHMDGVCMPGHAPPRVRVSSAEPGMPSCRPKQAQKTAARACVCPKTEGSTALLVGGSSCRMNFCTQHKKTDFECAAAACANQVHGELVYDDAQFLDVAPIHANRTVRGVKIDRTKYKRVYQPPIPGIRNGSYPDCHAYFCESCSTQLPHEVHTARMYQLDDEALGHFMRAHNERHIIVPESMSHARLAAKSGPGGRCPEIVIRVIGPGLTTGVAELDAQESAMMDTLYGPVLPGNSAQNREVINTRNLAKFVLRTSRLPVKTLDPSTLSREGLEKRIDGKAYNVLLGAYMDGKLVGRYTIELNKVHTQSRGVQICSYVGINHVYVDPAVRGAGVCGFMMRFSIEFTRLLKTTYGTLIDSILLNVEPSNVPMNKAAAACGFQLHWNPDDDPYSNMWTFSLRTSDIEAQQSNKKIRFMQHLNLPINVKTVRTFNFAFVYAYENRLKTAMHRIQIPTCTWYVQCDYASSAYQIYDYLESHNEHPPQQQWLDAQAAFFSSLSDDDHLTLLTYSYRGDQMVNRYILDNARVHGPGSKNPVDRSAGWYLNSIDDFDFLLFQPQLRKVYGCEFHVKTPADMSRIAEILRTWEIAQWKPVLDMYIADMRDLIARAPALQQPMTTYRGEQRSHIFGNLDSSGKPVKRMMSFSLDASVAAFFARKYKHMHADGPFDEQPGAIYKIIWRKGSKLIFTVGSNTTTDIIEMEVRAMEPRFSAAQCPLPHDVSVRFYPRHKNAHVEKKETYKIITLEADAGL